MKIIPLGPSKADPELMKQRAEMRDRAMRGDYGESWIAPQAGTVVHLSHPPGRADELVREE